MTAKILYDSMKTTNIWYQYILGYRIKIQHNVVWMNITEDVTEYSWNNNYVVTSVDSNYKYFIDDNTIILEVGRCAEIASNTFKIWSTRNSLTKHFRPNLYWAKSVYFNGPNRMLKFVQESACHSVYMCIFMWFQIVEKTSENNIRDCVSLRSKLWLDSYQTQQN